MCVAQMVVRRPATRQARIRFPSRHPYGEISSASAVKKSKRTIEIFVITLEKKINYKEIHTHEAAKPSNKINFIMKISKKTKLKIHVIQSRKGIWPYWCREYRPVLNCSASQHTSHHLPLFTRRKNHLLPYTVPYPTSFVLNSFLPLYQSESTILNYK